MKRIKIAILDTGVNYDHKKLSNNEISGFGLKVENGNVIQVADFYDKIGHGTAIFDIIRKKTNELLVEITNIKIFDDKLRINSKDFVLIMKFISEKYYFDIINISFGFKKTIIYSELNALLKKISDSGTIIVSAFDNNGGLSYPALHSSVIGVATTNDLKHTNITIDFRSPVNIIGSDRMYRVPWINNNFNIVRGSSYFCADIVSMFSNNLSNEKDVFSGFNVINPITNLKEISNLKDISLGNVAVFPFSKEEHLIARFEKLINADKIDYYSFKRHGSTNKKISDILPNCDNEKIVNSFKNLVFSNYDTLILGHIKELSLLDQVSYNKLIAESISNNIRILCFDNLEEFFKKFNCYYLSKIDKNHILDTKHKLFNTSKPVIMVAGTSSYQGKFTLQLKLRERLLGAKYNVGQIGTEPSSLLFGFDSSFPCGYGSNIELSITQIIEYVNQQLWEISEKDVDVIVCGTQSGLIPILKNNSYNFPIIHQIFFQTVNPDVVVLCVNIYDDIKVILNTIKYAESVSNGKVLGLVCFPLKIKSNWEGNLGKKINISNSEYILFKKNVFKNTGLPVYLLSNDDDINNLTNNILMYFSKK